MAVPAGIVRPEADDMLVPRAEVAELPPHHGLGLRVLLVELLHEAGVQRAALVIDECQMAASKPKNSLNFF